MLTHLQLMLLEEGVELNIKREIWPLSTKLPTCQQILAVSFRCGIICLMIRFCHLR
ncbi:hypothetical protein METHB2_270048 [Candidatus Methylobacter favarea]|uniref:Uncharacterized protein n=1 Tax=Candidatus Methylobacter favarea TaxID=2707345 RepID=A0A8S0X0N6_9GAMM|nr:hypothetical protein METHB2_270048 [Candidatus Methylobacter favarea]